MFVCACADAVNIASLSYQKSLVFILIFILNLDKKFSEIPFFYEASV
jgi:hypothetical protein